MKKLSLVLYLLLGAVLHIYFAEAHANDKQWLLVDNFESGAKLLSSDWFIEDVQNETSPFIPRPQVSKIITEPSTQNAYYLKQAAEDGIVGNRKALSYIKLPRSIEIGETYTLYTRIMVDAFPNNHSFGLSNLQAESINELSYNAFEPMLRVTDKTESDGTVNRGALMVIQSSSKGKATYTDVVNPSTKMPAERLVEKQWYELWYVINNLPYKDGGQRYSVYMKGGEFKQQTQVYLGAVFRMKREASLHYFVTISNTGSQKKPYGNGGLAYDDIYMSRGKNLSNPR
ncbi:hypothetical protein [Glaciecola sp. MH2013]|uniref:hypothetical protein n=1 Tax=Glaciecola sp. MH2013 TaxID=2785524 RepID=UPI001E295396|nr:hypothetical protein [Glaciecola sp. MH2013]